MMTTEIKAARSATAEALNDAAEAFARLDMKAETARLAALGAEIERIGRALATADERVLEINRTLSEARKADGGAVAAALLDGETATAAAALGPNRDALEAERESLRAGIRDLQDQNQEARTAREALQMQIRGLPIEAARPWVDAVMAEALDAGERLLHAFATVSAIHAVAPGFGPELDRLGYAAEGVAGTARLLPWRRDLRVLSHVREALKVLSDKGPFTTAPERVSIPAKTADRLEVVGAYMAAAKG